ncbi:hypothetical protein AAULR_03956, partial [Lacticaseibacillus rhamnosus MTCC 5462]
GLKSQTLKDSVVKPDEVAGMVSKNRLNYKPHFQKAFKNCVKTAR